MAQCKLQLINIFRIIPKAPLTFAEMVATIFITFKTAVDCPEERFLVLGARKFLAGLTIKYIKA